MFWQMLVYKFIRNLSVGGKRSLPVSIGYFNKLAVLLNMIEAVKLPD